MQEAVSGILIGRSREADGLSRMVTISMIVHGLVILVLLVVPREWLAAKIEPAPKTVMISMGGVQGAEVGGYTAIASRQVQSVAPTETKPVITPPAAKTPEMALPDPAVKPKPIQKPIDKPDDKSATRKPSTGEKIRSGAARAETRGAEVPFGGLASGGGGLGGARIEGDFCCPEYVETMKRLIYGNWNQHQGAPGNVEVKFTIRRDGMMTNVAVEKSSGNPLLDFESRRAVLVTQQIPPLPEQFTRQSLTVILIFEYKR